MIWLSKFFKITYNLERMEYLTSRILEHPKIVVICTRRLLLHQRWGFTGRLDEIHIKILKYFITYEIRIEFFLIFLLGKYEIHIKLKKTCQQIELRLDLFVWAFRSPVASRTFGPRSNESCNDKRGIHKGLTATCQFSTSWTQLELEVHSRYAY